MLKKFRRSRLRSQLTLILLAGLLGTAAVIGLPAITLINRQASSQAQQVLNEATLTARVFIQNEQSDLQTLALVISQRPTLSRILGEENLSALPGYLGTLQDGAGLDLVVICAGRSITAGSGRNGTTPAICQTASAAGFVVLAPTGQLYLFATAEVQGRPASAYRVVVGRTASAVLEDMREQTGHAFFLVATQTQVVSASEVFTETEQPTAADLLDRSRFPVGLSLGQRALALGNHRYLLSGTPMDGSADLHLVTAVDVENKIRDQARLNLILATALLVLAVAASILGIWLSRGISAPIAQLAEKATEFSHGNLGEPVAVRSSAVEIAQLANTLEDARVALHHSLTQLQAEKVWIEHLLNSIVEGVLALDTRNRITFASAGLGRLTGQASENLEGRHVDEVFVAAEGELPFSEQLPAAGLQRRISARIGTGGNRLLSISKAELGPPEASASDRALVIRDVTDEEYVHRLLGDFIANITHEFRTPLAALEASSELLLDNLHTLSRSELQELLVSLNLGITNLQNLIDNLIEAASIEAGRFKVSRQPVAMDAILKEALEIILPLAAKYSLEVVVQPIVAPCLVMADRRRTVQVLVNLLSNAIKHSPEKGRVEIRHSIQEDVLRLEVKDQGSGVPPEQRLHLFRRFAHLETPNERARQGAGLGLSVVKEIVEAHDGQVGVTENAGGGASFWFTIPLAPGQQVA